MRGSVFGPDYPAPRFARTPISVIRRVLTEIDNLEQAEANLASASTARLCYLVRQAVHVFSHAPGPLTDVDPRSYLPFPDWRPDDQKRPGPSDSTELVLKELVRRREIPMYVFKALITPPEDES